MTAPDFSDVTGEETDNKSSSPVMGDWNHKQVHIKGRWGTTTYTNEDPCYVCDREPDAVMLIGVKPNGKPETPDRTVNVCEAHIGDILGDLEYPREEVEIHEF